MHDRRDCGIHKLCLSGDEQNLARRMVFGRPAKLLKRGQYLYHTGEPLRAVYGVRSGSIKAWVVAADGRVQVIGFHIAGDPIGFSSFSAGQYTSDASALEETQVCELPLDSLQQFAKEAPGVQDQMLRIMSDEILRGQESMLLLGGKTAEQRLAGFLLSLSSRFARQVGVHNELTLSMSRSDIGSYLGIAEETVSRLFTQFQHDGLLTVHRRQITLNLPEKVSALAGEPGTTNNRFPL